MPSTEESREKTPEVQIPRVKATVPAQYPSNLRTQRVEATIVLQGTVDIDGNVGDTKVLACKLAPRNGELDGDAKSATCSIFAAAAQTAFVQWRFEPAMKDGKAACIYWTVKYEFKLKPK